MSQPPKTLVEAARSNDIDALYILLKINPFLLEEIDGIPFVDTPLHLAAAFGSTHFAIEVFSLKPSFGKKLNSAGFSPMHVAVRSGNEETVRRLVGCDSELIRNTGREGCTPLHYAAEVDDLVLLALFLEANPSSIRDLTAIHAAVKRGNLNAFKLFLGWLKRTGYLFILNREDEDGNTVLHIAVGMNNYEMVRLLRMIPRVRLIINQQNRDGLTALDIARGVSNARMIESALLSGGARTRQQLPAPSHIGSVPQYTASALKNSRFKDRLVEILRVLALSFKSLSDVACSNLLVVMGLIIAATYQAVLSPPGGLSSGDMNISTNNGTSVIASDQHPGKANMGIKWLTLMMGCNSISFILSMGSMILLLPESVHMNLFMAPLVALSMSYGFSYGIIDPQRHGYTIYFLGAFFVIVNIPFVWLKLYCFRVRKLLGEK